MDVDPAWLETDHYRTLGVAPDATAGDIVRAYRRSARDLHPDTNRDPDAVERFRALSMAYDVLRDPAKRRAYDRARRGSSTPRSGGGYSIRVENLDHLRGADVRDSTRRTVPGDVSSSRGSRRRTEPHPLFGRVGDDVTITVPVSYSEAVLGTEVSVPTLDGDVVRLRVPAGTPAGRTFRIRGRGIPGDPPGDLLVTVHLDVPRRLSPRQRQLIEELRHHDRTHLRAHLEHST